MFAGFRHVTLKLGKIANFKMQCGWPFTNWSLSKLEKTHTGHMILSLKQLILAGTYNIYSCVLLLEDFILNMFSCS